jgi:uncharacterized protein (TIGR03435 family)
VRILACVIAASIISPGESARAQEAELPAFEVASVKPRTGEPAPPASPSPGRFVYSDATLITLISFAFDVQDFQVIGGPDWIRSSRFDVSAKAAATPSQNQMRLMVRRLLVDRFGVRSHAETRDMPLYAMVKAKADGRLGDRLTPSTIDCPAILEAQTLSSAQPSGAPPVCLWRIGFGPAGALMTLDGAPLPRFARLLQPMLGRLVIDRTGLAGTFNIQLEFAPEQTAARFALPPPTRADAAPRDGLSLFTALEEQLGLSLESVRGPVPVVVIDSAQQPTPD